MLVEKGEIVSNDEKIAEILNNFFDNAVKELNLSIDQKYINNNTDLSDPISSLILKYENHPSIIAIKQLNSRDENKFSFNKVTVNDIERELKYLNCKKANQKSDILTKLIKENTKNVASVILDSFNSSVTSGYYPELFKLADITPTFKKDDRTNKSNYRPISILPNLSKIYERLMHTQLTAYFDKFFSDISAVFARTTALKIA